MGAESLPGHRTGWISGCLQLRETWRKRSVQETDGAGLPKVKKREELSWRDEASNWSVICVFSWG
jgi:hypothetical protein